MPLPRVTCARVKKGKPCPNCPWRVASVGRVTSEEVAVLAPIKDQPGLAQGCHADASRVCAGFVISVARNDANLAFPLSMGKANIWKDVTCPDPLFPSWETMLTAHQVG